MKLSGLGDVCMPGDVHCVEQASEQGLVTSHKNARCFIPVILVQKGNPKKIHPLVDLARLGIDVGLGNPDVRAIGRKSLTLSERNGIALDDVRENLRFQVLTVNDLGNHIKLKRLDAVIVWDAMAAYFAANGDVLNEGRCEYSTFPRTDSNGNFSSGPLHPGTYVICFNATKLQGKYAYPKIGKEIVVAGKTAGTFQIHFGPVERNNVTSDSPFGVGTLDVELVATNPGYKFVKRIPSEPLRITDTPDHPELVDGVRFIRPNQVSEFELLSAREPAPKTRSAAGYSR